MHDMISSASTGRGADHSDAAPASERSLPERVRDTFVAPGRLFAGFGASPPWFWVLAISTLVTVLASALEPAEVFLEQMEDPVTRRGKPVEIVSDPAEVVRYGRILAAMSALVAHPIVAFSLAGVLTLVFTVLGRGEAPFRQYLAVAAHLLLIPAAGTLLVLALRAATGDANVMISPALLLPEGDGMAREILGALNPFSIWMLAAAAVAVDRLNRRITWWRAGAVLLGTYLFLVALVATLARP